MRLSDKIFLEKEWIGDGGGIPTKDIKQAVKELKEKNMDRFVQDGMFMNHSYQDWLDEVFGEELV